MKNDQFKIKVQTANDVVTAFTQFRNVCGNYKGPSTGERDFVECAAQDGFHSYCGLHQCPLVEEAEKASGVECVSWP